MNLAFVWGGAAVLAAWAILVLLGNEREQKMRNFEANRPLQAAPEPEKKPAAAPPPAASPMAAKPQRKAA